MSCLYIITDEDGTSYCKLAEIDVKKFLQMKKALEFYADEKMWIDRVFNYDGNGYEIAQEALGEDK